MLRTLKNNNIIALYDMWLEKLHGTLNFNIEVCTSGNLREYRKKHGQVSLKALKDLKKWSKQILRNVETLQICNFNHKSTQTYPHKIKSDKHSFQVYKEFK